MPKFGKEKRDLIFDLIEKDYTNVEIAERVGVSAGTVSRYRKNAPKKEGKSDPEIGLSDKSMNKLYNLQGMLGKNSLNEAIDEIYKYSVEIMKKKFDYDPESEKTPSDIFEYVTKQEREYSRLKKGKRESLTQREILKCLGMDEITFNYYEFEKQDGYVGTLVDFMTEYTIRYFNEVRNVRISTLKKYPFLDKNNLPPKYTSRVE
jgi:transcriptional regulator with XRE-family HTH domain